MSFPPLGLGPLILIAFVPLMISVYTEKKRSFVRGFLTGSVFYSLLLFWINKLAVTGQIRIFLFVGYVFLCIYLSLYMGLFSLILSKAKKQLYFILLSAVTWTAFEFIRSQTSQVGFPWGMTAYSLARSPLLIQIASIGGVYLLVFWIMAVNSAVALLFTKKRTPFFILPFLLISNTFYGVLCLRREDNGNRMFSVAIVQPNISQDLKGEESEIARLQRMHILLEKFSVSCRESGADLIVLPETSWPWPVKSIYPVITPHSEPLADTAKKYSTPILAGAQDIVQLGENYRPTNSVFLIEKDGTLAGRHDKIYLVPFGEHIPFDDVFPFLTKIQLGQSDYLPGKNEKPPCSDGICFGIGICYESAFSQYFRGLVLKGAGVLINVTDDQWFGKTAGPEQHADMFILRAVENRRWGVRCANTGVSYIVDPWGRIRVSTSPYEEIILLGTVGVRNDKSPYSFLFGDLIGLFSALCLSFLVLMSIINKRRKRCMMSSSSEAAPEATSPRLKARE
ncbi:apolipoprotein N-acyltransferase [candidate division WOR-3 bacterium]|nr:apolipoprotein N-acyltransferase [candidate division WOR-3 bacterium]